MTVKFRNAAQLKAANASDQEVRAERAAVFARMDYVYRASVAADRDMTADERREYNALEAILLDIEAMPAISATVVPEHLTNSGPVWGDPSNGTDSAPNMPAGFPGARAQRDDRGAWARNVADKLLNLNRGDTSFRAALTTGGVQVPEIIAPVVQTPVEPYRVLDLLVSRKLVTENVFTYLRQTVRNGLAAPVADGDLKPTSAYTFAPTDGRLRVFAHLSEALPLWVFEDITELVRVLRDQMAEDLARAIERDVLVGDGTGEHFTGVANTSGIQVQPLLTGTGSTAVQNTLRRARTAMLTAGETPTAWVMNHADLETFDVSRNGDGDFMTGLDEHVFGGLPKVGTSVLPAGTAYLADWSQCTLLARQGGTRIDADGTGALFDRNQVKLRVEGRFGFAMLRPQAFMKVRLTSV